MNQNEKAKLRVAKGGIKLSAGQAANQGLSFLKNVIIARLLSPSDYGVAATFAITLSILEMTSNIAADKLMIQSHVGESEEFQATIQFMQFLRGCINASILLLIGGPVAKLFGIPEVSWAFRSLAFIPFARGMIHQDVNRLQRNMRFGPIIVSETGANLISTLLAYPLGYWFRDYTAMLWIILAQAATATSITHVMSERRYRFGFDKKYMAQMFTFGWPLLINGLLMFGIFQGDRLIIGSANSIFGREIYGLDQLGLYSVVFALTYAPTMIIANVSTSLFLPLLSSCQMELERFARRYKMTNQVVAIVGGTFTIPLILCGDALVRLIYGPRYAVDPALVGWLSAMQALRIFRVAPTLAAMAKGDTKNAMYSNMFRSIALLGGLVVAYIGGKIYWFAVSGFLGEVVAYVFCVFRLQVRHGMDSKSCFIPVFVTFSYMILGGVTKYLLGVEINIFALLGLSFITDIIFVVIYLMLFRGLWKDISDLILSRGGRLNAYANG